MLAEYSESNQNERKGNRGVGIQSTDMIRSLWETRRQWNRINMIIVLHESSLVFAIANEGWRMLTASL
jgi:hypothetical protein